MTLILNIGSIIFMALLFCYAKGITWPRLFPTNKDISKISITVTQTIHLMITFACR